MKCAKSILRTKLKENRNKYVKQLNKEEIDIINHKISNNLKIYLNQLQQQDEVEFSQKNIRMAGFYPINNEINCIEIMKSLEQNNYICCLPVHYKNEEQKPLYFREYNSSTELIIADYNIPVPNIQSQIIQPNIILTPFLGFNKYNLQRIGYGGGHFDRTIKSFRDMNIKFKFIGIGYEKQYVEDLPIEEQDEPLDCIITENGIYTKELFNQL